MTTQEMELAIVTAVVEDLLAEGFELRVDDGGDEQERVDTPAAAIDALTAVDSSDLFVFKHGQCTGFVSFVFGNDGYDVICDNSVWLEPYLARATQLSDEMQGA